MNQPLKNLVLAKWNLAAQDLKLTTLAWVDVMQMLRACAPKPVSPPFLTGALFIMFAEDVELLPKHGFLNLLTSLHGAIRHLRSGSSAFTSSIF